VGRTTSLLQQAFNPRAARHCLPTRDEPPGPTSIKHNGRQPNLKGPRTAIFFTNKRSIRMPSAGAPKRTPLSSGEHQRAPLAHLQHSGDPSAR